MNVWLCHIGHEEGHDTPVAFFDRLRARDWVHEMKKKLKQKEAIHQKYKGHPFSEERINKEQEEIQKFCDDNGIRDTLYKVAWYELIDVQ